jgi:hypothetical protein
MAEHSDSCGGGRRLRTYWLSGLLSSAEHVKTGANETRHATQYCRDCYQCAAPGDDQRPIMIDML